uniref:Uncharacterized protein n=1 Tax=Trichobilharzia regenti TaxID=157069 RepID=A0AA85KML9_TRIRE|nr:unnamed protein product [Trichobilharzia regenti]
MPHGKNETIEEISKIPSDEHSTSITRRNTAERISIFSWKDDSCFSISENTKSKDFRRKRYKRQKGEYTVVKDPTPEALNELIDPPQDEDNENVNGYINTTENKQQ